MKTNSRILLAVICIAVAAILGGGMPTLTKFALTAIPPFTFTFLRFLIAAVCIWPFFLKSRGQILKTLFWSSVIPVSLLATANVVLFAFGVRLTSPTVSQTLYTA